LAHAQNDPLPDGVRVVDYGIRGMHLAYDLLDGVDALVLIDAVPASTAGGGGPGRLVTLRIGPADLGSGEFDAHGMSPVAVLASLGPMGGELPPTYLVGCVPADVSEGIGLSAPVAAAVDEGAQTVTGLVQTLVTGQLTSSDRGTVG
jgi:hydrogenase maturation protease